MRRIPPLLALGLAACPAPRRPEACDLVDEVAELRRRWPTAADALAARDVYGLGAVWYWAHGKRSTDGFGATLALVDDKPSPLVALDPIEDLPGRFKLRKPSLLFYDATDGAPDEWSLVGAGYHYPFTPCVRPSLDCVGPEQFWVHEAGYHHVPIGDGGMSIATDDDLPDGLTRDPERCNPIADDDLESKFGSIKHGRAWVVHLWFSPEEGEQPIVALRDPFERWRDAPARDHVHLEDPVFGRQELGSCTCPADSAEERPRGCGG